MKNIETTEQVFAFIQAYWQAHRFSPTHREIAEGCYIAKSTVLRHIDRLEAQGRIERVLNLSRSISIVDKRAD